MPAPLAKGLIFSLTILIAAGLAVYDNPQVRQWVDSSRRKIALALHSLGDEIGPNSNSRESAPDASTREDEGPEAVERRRKARQEILERARTLEEKRRARQETARERLRSFDTLVDKEGALIDEREVANTTSTEIQSTFNEQDLRKRNTESNAAALGSAFANPFTDELHTDVNRGQEMVSSGASICSHTPTLHESQVNRNTASSPQPQLLTDTDEISNHPSEALVDLTPTTSTSSAVHAEIPDHSNRNSPPQNPWSVREWAESTAPAFYSPPRSEAAELDDEEQRGFATPATGEHLSRAGSEANPDVWSEFGDRISTPGSWTEVGSVVSEDY